ncbi:MAG TPA: hypothetical protein DCX60_02875, partial [Phycisphaerales bacterium]|nr:hypothetical protein [Phycisphaerales bacterium]
MFMNFPSTVLSFLVACLLQSLMLTSAHGQVRIQGSAVEYSTISAAVSASSSGDVIEVDSGVYYESGITISHPLQIRAVQIISNQPQVTIDASGMGRHFLVQADCTLEGLHLRNGDVSGTGDGGAILHDSGALVLNDCVVESSAANSGGGIAGKGGDLTLVRSQVFSCNASIDGGGIHVGGASSQSQPTGTFVESGQALGNANSWSVALGDVDGDGDLDAVVAAISQPTYLWTNDGTGTFTNSGQALGNTGATSVAFGDVDGDGDLDAVVAAISQPTYLWINDGTGIFTNSGQQLENSNCTSVALGDVDGDGDLDAMIANEGFPNTLLINDGAGIFTDSGQSLGNPGSTASKSVALGDLDGDGDLDATFANALGDLNTVWTNDG